MACGAARPPRSGARCGPSGAGHTPRVSPPSPERPLLVATARGPARAVVHAAAEPRGMVVLLHGAGSGTDSAPLPELADALASGGLTAVRLDQPYRVAGRRAPDPAHLLDGVLLEVVGQLRGRLGDLPLALVGRSSGARVACRTAATLRPWALVALGFPWRPPPSAGRPPKADRGGELRAGAAVCRVLVVQGDRDPFGRPVRTRGVRTAVVPALGHSPDSRSARLAARWLLSDGPGE